jgi:hypothetical protein
MANISSLNDQIFNELDSSLLLTLGNGLTQTGGTYVASPNSIGLATYDNWVGTINAGPGSGDVVSYKTVVSNPGLGVVTYQTTLGDGSVNPASGGIGAEVVAWNATGVLLEQLAGYVPGQTTLSPDGDYLILENSSVNLATYDAAGNPIPEGATLAELTFGTTGAFPTFAAVPEPSTLMLMPVALVLLMVSRIRSVRSFLGRL